jgi:hypothetical protein
VDFDSVGICTEMAGDARDGKKNQKKNQKKPKPKNQLPPMCTAAKLVEKEEKKKSDRYEMNN